MTDNIMDEIERINNIKRMKNKKKLHSILDKYGSLENFRQNSTMAEDFEYQFAQGDDIIAEVEQERQALSSLPKTSGSSLDDTDMAKNASIYRARNEIIDKDIFKDALRMYYPTVYHALNEKDRLTPMNISDENKHQYVSCVGSQGGITPSLITLLGGVGKEVKDIKDKLRNSKQRKKYGGTLGVLKDSVKDMKNNLYGAGYGFIYDNQGDCNILLKHKIK
jgi:hypothetical protein